MFWVALATAIMLLSGDGDDTRIIVDLIAALRQQISLTVGEPKRAAKALRGIDLLEQSFKAHRSRLNEYMECVTKVDHNFSATEADYARCDEGLEKEAQRLAKSFVRVSDILSHNITPAENKAIEAGLNTTPHGKKLSASVAALKGVSPEDVLKGVTPPRSRGLEGQQLDRHLTLPRNVVSLLFGPLHPQTFGQRYTNGSIEGGTAYRRRRWTGGNGARDPDQWFTRLGVAFGLFDDFEAGALFVPLELAPEFQFDRVLVFLTQQFRLEHYDLALRLSFQTPGDGGWSLNPGGLFRWSSGINRLDVGVHLPMDLGALKDPQAMVVGINIPIRETIQFSPHWFMTAETGIVRTSLVAGEQASIPLGLGAGYTILAGKRIIELTALFQWDDFLLPAGKGGVDVFQPGSYRAAFGIATQMQAL